MGKEKVGLVQMTGIRVDMSKTVRSSDMRGENRRDTSLLKGMLREAEDYLLAFKWCKKIEESYFGLGVGGVVAVFLFKIVPGRVDVDEWIWVVVGDLPPAYITTDDAPNAACALDGYIGAMLEWVEAVLAGRSVEKTIPVNAAPTRENALALRSRLAFLDKEILGKYYSGDVRK